LQSSSAMSWLVDFLNDGYKLISLMYENIIKAVIFCTLYY
jgi:hypothetical protein